MSANAEQYCLKKQLSGDAKHSNVTPNTRFKHSNTDNGSAPCNSKPSLGPVPKNVCTVSHTFYYTGILTDIAYLLKYLIIHGHTDHLIIILHTDKAQKFICTKTNQVKKHLISSQKAPNSQQELLKPRIIVTIQMIQLFLQATNH